MTIYSIELPKALTEVREILSGYDKRIIQQIPTTFLDFIDENYNKDYFPNIDKTKNINEQELLQTTRVILAIVYEKYLLKFNERRV